MRQAQKGLRNLRENVEDHQNWIKDPTLYPDAIIAVDDPNIPRWINDWKQDIIKNQGEADKYEKALKILEKALDAACKCWYKPWTWF